MSILIKGMSMPEKGHILSVVIQDGKVICANSRKVLSKDVIELPPHGRLIDADAFEYTCKFNYCNGCEDWTGLKCKTCWVDDMLGELENAPTVIESEGENGTV